MSYARATARTAACSIPVRRLARHPAGTWPAAGPPVLRDCPFRLGTCACDQAGPQPLGPHVRPGDGRLRLARTGCSAAWLARLLWEQEAASSNLAIPTTNTQLSGNA